VRDGPNAFIREGECLWARTSWRELDQDSTFQTFGFDETNYQASGGGQFALSQNWRLGLALGYEHSELKTDTNAKAEGDRLQGGAAVKYNPGALLLAAGVSGGYGWYDTDRPIAFPGFAALSSADNEIGVVDGRLRAAYLVDLNGWYLKPMVDLDATRIDLNGVREHGAGGASLKVRGNDETVLSATPALELGTQAVLAGGTYVRPFVRGGATFFDDPEFTILASFEGAPGGIGPFRIRTETDEVIGNLGAGVDFIGPRGGALRLFYEGSFGDLVEEHAAGVKGSLPF
jgi:outer membrane autotransporter protein